jgi:hypothetical protein
MNEPLFYFQRKGGALLDQMYSKDLVNLGITAIQPPISSVVVEIFSLI